MAKYMFVLGSTGATPPNHGLTPEQVTQKYREWSGKLAQQGKLLAGHKLRDREGKRLTLDGGKVVDGPYTETKETIGGFYIVEAASYEEAVQLARECPTVVYQGGWCEVRLVEI